jgi:hypothetical protein
MSAPIHSLKPGDASPRSTTQARLILAVQVLILVALSTAVLYPVLNGPWSGDDDLYLTGNELMKDPHRIWKAWFEPGSFVEYYPLEQTVQWLEYKRFGIGTDAPFYYRVPSLVLHILSALLVWALFARMRLRFAWLGGLLFALHPLNVDSIGQITELKNTLSLPPFLIALIFFVDFEETRSARSYAGCLGFFLVAMLCKITMAFFPLFMPIYAWWKRGRVTGRDLLAAAPFLLVSVALSYLTVHAGAVYDAANDYSNPGRIYLGGFASRFALTGMTLVFYFGRCLFPLWPMPIYPLWKVDPPSPAEFLPWLAIALVLTTCWVKRRTWGRHIFLGLSFFTLGLLPFLGFHDVTFFCITWVQDHFLYLPMLGLLGLVIAGLEHLGILAPRLRGWFSGALAASLVLLCAYQSHAYASIYGKPLQLWTYNYQFSPNSWGVTYQLGKAYLIDEQRTEGRRYVEESVQSNPDFWLTWDLLGETDRKLGQYDRAIPEFEKALAIDPRETMPREFLGLSYLALNRATDAEENFREILEQSPYMPDFHADLAMSLAAQGRIPDCVAELRIAVQLDPSNTKYRFFLDKMTGVENGAAP